MAASAASCWTSAYGVPLGFTSSVAPVARAPASKQRSTLARISSSSAAALLGRGADDAHREADVIGDARGGDARADGDGGDQVVPAGVADAGEAVVLGAQGQVERPRAAARHERRREASDAALDGEAGGVEGFGAPRGGALLLEGQLGMGVDAVAQRDQAVPARGDPLADGGSGIHGDLRLQLPEGGAQRQGWGRGPLAFVRLPWYSGVRPVS